MSRYTIIYDDGGLTIKDVTGEWLQNALNDNKNFFHGHTVMSEFPTRGPDAHNLWDIWPDKSLMIFKDGAIYVPEKKTVNKTVTVTEYVVEE